jgi:hypothetical protein
LKLFSLTCTCTDLWFKIQWWSHNKYNFIYIKYVIFHDYFRFWYVYEYKYGSILWLEDGNLYLHLRKMSHTIYAANRKVSHIHHQPMLKLPTHSGFHNLFLKRHVNNFSAICGKNKLHFNDEWWKRKKEAMLEKIIIDHSLQMFENCFHKWSWLYGCVLHRLIQFNLEVTWQPASECDWLFYWQHKLCATFSANVNINYHLPIKVYYRICTLGHIRIEINHGSQNVVWVLTWIGEWDYTEWITRSFVNKAKEGGDVRISF